MKKIPGRHIVIIILWICLLLAAMVLTFFKVRENAISSDKFLVGELFRGSCGDHAWWIMPVSADYTNETVTIIEGNPFKEGLLPVTLPAEDFKSSCLEVKVTFEKDGGYYSFQIK